MSMALTAFTRRGVTLALRIQDVLGEGTVWTLPKFARGNVICYDFLSQWTKERFAAGDDLIFVGAAGIAVRSIAPFLRDKYSDPAVLVIDEGGRFVIPILSGHVGGANALSRRVAQAIGAVPVITTATDVNGRFAVDQWAAEHDVSIPNPAAAKAISAALLAGQRVGFWSELPHGPLPEGVTEEIMVPGFTLTCQEDSRFPAGALVLHPKLLTVGVGCKRGVPEERLEKAVTSALSERNLSRESVSALATIDRKWDEQGLLALAQKWRLPMRCFSAEELNAVPGVFTPSSFVRSVTGVDNVCERSAVLATEGGELLVPKCAGDGVTVAIARKKVFYNFFAEEG